MYSVETCKIKEKLQYGSNGKRCKEQIANACLSVCAMFMGRKRAERIIFRMSTVCKRLAAVWEIVYIIEH